MTEELTSAEIITAEIPAQHTAVVRGQVDHDGIADFLGDAFTAVITALGAEQTEVAGPPFARYQPGEDSTWAVEAGFPVDSPVTGGDRVSPSSLPGGHVARTVHRGAYDAVATAYQRLESWVTDNGYAVTDAPWECYLDEPSVTEPRTLVVMPCEVLHAPE